MSNSHTQTDGELVDQMDRMSLSDYPENDALFDEIYRQALLHYLEDDYDSDDDFCCSFVIEEPILWTDDKMDTTMT